MNSRIAYIIRRALSECGKLKTASSDPKKETDIETAFRYLLCCALAFPATAVAGPTPDSGSVLVPNDRSVVVPLSAEECAILDDDEARSRMDGLRRSLAWSCGRLDLLGTPPAEPGSPAFQSGGTGIPDAQVNGDIGNHSVQSETSIAENLVTGTLCAGFNDTCEFMCPNGGGGFTGFARSTDGGVTWDDRGSLGAVSFGDPSLVWRRADGRFYFATLASGGGLIVYTSSDDCQAFVPVSTPSTVADDKQFLAVDNTGGPHDGNLYLVWADFEGPSLIVGKRSTDGGATWSDQVTIGAGSVQGAWPTVAPDGDVYVAWTRFFGTLISIQAARSTDGGLTYQPVSDVATTVTRPRDATATATCGQSALNGNIRYFAFPQIAAAQDPSNPPDGVVLHAVYSYDPDGLDVGDVVDIFYRRSTDRGATWGPEVRLNDDGTSSDQYFPTLAVRGQTVMVSFYDRRLDPANLLQDTFKATSEDGGLTWGSNQRVSDVSTPILFDPGLSQCYHGDYDQSLIDAEGRRIVLWADDRNTAELGDVYSEASSAIQVPVFADGFESGDLGAWRVVVP